MSSEYLFLLVHSDYNGLIDDSDSPRSNRLWYVIGMSLDNLKDFNTGYSLSILEIVFHACKRNYGLIDKENNPD